MNNKNLKATIFGIAMVTILVGFLFKGFDLESLAENKVINPDKYEHKIPPWVKGISGFWAQDLVDDNTYFTSLQYLIDHGYITISKQTKQIHDYGNTTISCTCDMEER